MRVARTTGPAYGTVMTIEARRLRAGPGLLLAAALLAAALLAAGCDAGDAGDAGNNGRAPIDIAALGPQQGERVPDFSLPDQHGRVVTLDSILRPNGAILMFYRSADW